MPGRTAHEAAPLETANPSTRSPGPDATGGTRPGTPSSSIETYRWLGRVVASLAMAGGILALVLSWQVADLADRTITRLARERIRVDRASLAARFGSTRGVLLQTIADELRQTRPSATPDEAKDLAAMTLRAVETYPAVDPLLFASTGIVDASHRSSGSTHTGLHQPDASVASQLAEELGWTVDDELLDDPERASALAARHLDRLHGAYNDVTMVLAEYNGGVLNAAYIRARQSRLSPATKKYVAEVLEIYERLTQRLAERRAAPSKPVTAHQQRTSLDVGSENDATP